MPLIDAFGLKADGFSRLEGDETLPAGDVILPLARLAAEAGTVLGRGDRLGVQLPNIANIDEIAPLLDRLSLVSIAFPSFSDGRGFSLGKRLRQRGFRGVLRANGPLIADQMRHAFGCGFDEIDVSDAMLRRQPVAHWLAGLGAITLRYQRDGEHGLSILDQRLSARQASDRRRVVHAA